ncbi:hypothetical protein FRC06_010713 [Ceratobasidium sp. 370]|nr:hypothetical protein FRC06_010713 [Ceratobasidium sp. 370]
MSDPQDRRMADLFETELRLKAELDPGNTWELIWFLRLPLETRCSYMRILEARIDQESTRRFLFRQACYRQRNWRDQTRECTLIQAQEPSRPFASLGQRQRRKPIEYGRSRTRKPRNLPSMLRSDPAVPVPPAAPKHRATAQCARAKSKPTTMVSPRDDPPGQDAVPPRPPTPDGLRLALLEDEELRIQASGYDPATLDVQMFSPRTPVTPPEPARYDLFPLYAPGGGPIVIDNKPVPRLIAYMVAAGRHYVAPWQNYSIQQAAYDVSVVELATPGFLARLIMVLFPLQPIDWAAAVHPCPDTVLDFMRGWSIIPQARLLGEMPDPAYGLCGCGNIRALSG